MLPENNRQAILGTVVKTLCKEHKTVNVNILRDSNLTEECLKIGEAKGYKEVQIAQLMLQTTAYVAEKVIDKRGKEKIMVEREFKGKTMNWS
jgi:hypothetical protein